MKDGMLVLRITKRMQAALKRAARTTQARMPEGYTVTMSSMATSYIAAGLKLEEGRNAASTHKSGSSRD